MHFYFILSFIGTLILLYTLWVLTTAFNIKYGLGSIFFVLLGLVFIGCATYLCTVSTAYMVFHGATISLFIMFFSVDEESTLRKLFNGLLAFLWWPQFVCLMIFIFCYANQIGNE